MTVLLDALAPELGRLDAGLASANGDPERALAVVLQQAFSALTARAAPLDERGAARRRAVLDLEAHVSPLDPPPLPPPPPPPPPPAPASSWDLGPIRALVAVAD